MYRDSFEKCPHCAIELVDARSARGCRACGGLWIEEQVLTEMIHAMLPPRPWSRLVLAVIERTGAPIGCPTCGTVMELTSIHGVSIDRCARHGIWFDALELQAALHRVADPDLAPPLEMLGETRTVPSAPRPPVASAPPSQARPSGEVELVFRVRSPDRPPREVRVQQSVVKLGKLASSHVRLDGDDDVSRMHAVIEVNDADEVVVIDLGSRAGTWVNGAKVDKRTLQSGDKIQLGETLLELTIVPRPRRS